MSDQFQVVGECAYATADTAVGRAKTLLYKGAFVSPEAPELEHLLSTGLVAKVGAGASAGVNADGKLVGVDKPPAASKPDSTVPDASSSKADLVKYLAGRGYSRDELAKQDHAELVALAKRG